MVESLVVVATLTLLYIALLYMRGAYDARLATQRNARKDVWPATLQACQGGGGGGLTSGSDGSLGMLAAPMTPALLIAQGNSLRRPLQTNLETRQSLSSRSAAGHDTVHGPLPALTLTTTNVTVCNEKQGTVSQGDLRTTIHLLYGTML